MTVKLTFKKMKLLNEKPQKDGTTTIYKCGLTVSGSWASRIQQHEKYCKTTVGEYILKLEEKTVHEVKIAAPFFKQVQSGIKTFELRYNDRNYRVGDTLILNEVDRHGFKTGAWIKRTIVVILTQQQLRENLTLNQEYIGLVNGWVILGLK